MRPININKCLSLILLTFGCFYLKIAAERDFQFNDELFVTLAEPQPQDSTIADHHVQPSQQHQNSYSKEVAKCPYSENKIILSLILKTKDWPNIVENKRNRIVNKLSKFFGIPKEFLRLESITKKEILEMSQRSIKRGPFKYKTNRHLGKIEFMIGCGQSSLFAIGESISKQIGQQMKDGSIDDITGIDFGWWVIWRKKITNRVQRNKRDVLEGSGEDDYYEYDDEDDDEISEITTTPSHAHRHHHGIPKNHDETTVVPLTDEIVVVTNIDTTTTPSTTTTTATTTTTSTESSPPPITTTTTSTTTTSLEYVTEPSTTFTSTISATTLASVLREDDEGAQTDETPKEYDLDGGFNTTPNDTTILPRIMESTTTSTTTKTTPIPETTTITTTTTTTTTTPLPTTEYIEPEPVNTPPMIKTRLAKQPVTAGKPFSLIVPIETFYDNEDETNLRLGLFDKNGHELKSNSWVQFNAETREIYGLALEESVSRWQYKLIATDSANETVTETLDISVQQHKGHRSVNHEISIGVKLNQKFLRNIDWQIRLIKGIAETLNDSISNIVVRDVRQNQQDPFFATFLYTNESLPKDKCPEEELDQIISHLDRYKIDALVPELSIKSVTGQLIGPCLKHNIVKTKPTPHMRKNQPPLPRNQVDRVNASSGHLLVFKVPSDTFYDTEDTTDLKLKLLTMENKPLSPRNWLQFDPKNQEFYGIPKAGDIGSEEYVLVAEDHEGLTASDALVVVVNNTPKRDYNVYFKVFLGIRHEVFNSLMQRKFVERIAQLFNDPSPQYIQIRSITTHHDADGTIVNFFNTTLHRTHSRCPEEEIEMVRNIWFAQESNLRDRVRKSIGVEFNITNVQMMPLTSCHHMGGDIHRDIIPIKTDDNKNASTFKDDYMLTFVLPAIIIIAMILLASVIACALHRRRLTGKMELGDEEERKSFRSKGIPVIFQDELDEKPEIGNKSPIIMKNEKPPLLPPSYNSTNIDGDNDCDEYVPPPAVVSGGREIRGKSPVTPSYRKPPPYVSP